MQIERLLTAVTRHGLLPNRPEAVVEVLPARAWNSLLAEVRSERLIGLLALAVNDGTFTADEEQRTQVNELHASAMSSCLTLERELLSIVKLLEGAGFAYRVLKGASFAHLDYPDPALRPFGDLDILVRSDQFDEVAATLAAAGYTRRSLPFRDGFDKRFGKGATFATDELEVDLHRTFVVGPFGLVVELEDLWTASETFLLAGRPVAALTREERFLNACFNAALADFPPRLLAMRDVAQLLSGALDVDVVKSMASRWRADHVVARAVTITEHALGLAGCGLCDDWHGAQSDDPWQVQALRVYRGASYATQSMASLGAIAGARNKAAFLSAVAMPSREYLEHVHHGYTSWWRRIAHSALSGRSK